MAITATSARDVREPLMRFIRLVQGFAEASVVVIAFAVAILLLGLPVALAVRVVHEIVSWFARGL